VKRERTWTELARPFDVHPNRIKQWKDQPREGAAGVLEQTSFGYRDYDDRDVHIQRLT